MAAPIRLVPKPQRAPLPDAIALMRRTARDVASGRCRGLAVVMIYDSGFVSTAYEGDGRTGYHQMVSGAATLLYRLHSESK